MSQDIKSNLTGSIIFLAGGAATLFLLGVLVWSFSASYTRAQMRTERHTAYYADEAVRLLKERCAHTDPGIVAPCVTAILSAQHENQRAESDLSAQTQMANWAFWLLIVTLGSTGITLAGIWFVRENLIAVRTANASAREAYDLAERSSIRQLRAYLNVSPEGINPLRVRKEVVGHILLKNVGHVIAKEVRLVVNLVASANRDYDPAIEHATSNVPNPIGALLPNAEVRRGSRQTVARSEIDPNFSPPLYVFVWGKVQYEDGFGNSCTTNFCHRYSSESTNVDYMSESSSISKMVCRIHETGNDAN